MQVHYDDPDTMVLAHFSMKLPLFRRSGRSLRRDRSDALQSTVRPSATGRLLRDVAGGHGGQGAQGPTPGAWRAAPVVKVLRCGTGTWEKAQVPDACGKTMTRNTSESMV